MNKSNNLISIAKEVEQAFQIWRSHPDDIACQRQYEKVKIRLDNEIK